MNLDMSFIIVAIGVALFLVSFLLEHAKQRVRLKKRVILITLSKVGELSGLRLSQLTGIARGSVYVYLTTLEEDGWVVSRVVSEPGYLGGKRRYYRLADSVTQSEMLDVWVGTRPL